MAEFWIIMDMMVVLHVFQLVTVLHPQEIGQAADLRFFHRCGTFVIFYRNRMMFFFKVLDFNLLFTLFCTMLTVWTRACVGVCWL